MNADFSLNEGKGGTAENDGVEVSAACWTEVEMRLRKGHVSIVVSEREPTRAG